MYLGTRISEVYGSSLSIFGACFITKVSNFLLLYLQCQSAVQKGSEVNLTLGGIDLNNSGRLACNSKLDLSVLV